MQFLNLAERVLLKEKIKCRRNGKLFHGSSKLEKGKNWEQTWVAGLVLQNALNTNHLPAVLHNIWILPCIPKYHTKRIRYKCIQNRKLLQHETLCKIFHIYTKSLMKFDNQNTAYHLLQCLGISLIVKSTKYQYTYISPMLLTEVECVGESLEPCKNIPLDYPSMSVSNWIPRAPQCLQSFVVSFQSAAKALRTKCADSLANQQLKPLVPKTPWKPGDNAALRDWS